MAENVKFNVFDIVRCLENAKSFNRFRLNTVFTKPLLLVHTDVYHLGKVLNRLSEHRPCSSNVLRRVQIASNICVLVKVKYHINFFPPSLPIIETINYVHYLTIFYIFYSNMNIAPTKALSGFNCFPPIFYVLPRTIRR